ncbi:MAG: phosphoribosylanthranilate isomerase [Pelagibacteraceae bacterium]|jgi:phosphoribosylanthranilate isomerase|nr:phosphoribosylanthranilate isomerase [Pelagibacteraceae bacterium]
MQAKICGLKTTQQVEACIEYGANFCGFILNYKKSHRHIEYKTADQLTKIYKKNTAYVGVLVSPTMDEIKKFSNLNLDYFQIYGNYTNEQIQLIRTKYNKKIIMALQIKEEQDVLKYKNYENIADIILFDSSGLHQSLSWNYNWIKIAPFSITKMLAGNINMDMLESLKEITDIVDVSGALETNKVKDIIKIKNFLKKIKQIND